MKLTFDSVLNAAKNVLFKTLPQRFKLLSPLEQVWLVVSTVVAFFGDPVLMLVFVLLVIAYCVYTELAKELPTKEEKEEVPVSSTSPKGTSNDTHSEKPESSTGTKSKSK